MAIPRMRTAQGVYDEIKALDPNSEVTMHFIRYLIHAEKVPVVPVGRKKLVNLDEVIAFLSRGTQTEEEHPAYGQIRRVPV